jgi:tetratricopeptide (TPR) repeat protein
LVTYSRIALLAAALLLRAADVPLRDLERAYQAQPGVYANGWNLALAYFELGRLKEARAHIERLLEKGQTAELHNLHGAVLEKSGVLQEAAREFEAAARLEPSEKNLGDWAGFLVRRAAIDPAIAIYRRAIELHAKSAALRIGLGLAYHGRGEYDEAAKWICAAVDLDPNDPRPIPFLGSLVDTSPKFAPEISRRLANFVRLYPQNPQAHVYYALSLPKENSALIESHLKTAAGLDSTSFEARLHLGILYERLGKDDDAIRVLTEAIDLKPESEAAHYRLARVYQRSGKSALAEREFEKLKRLRVMK